MTPKNKTENLLIWGAALGVAVLLSFLSGIATHWPDTGIDWRGVFLDVIQTILTTAPIVAAGLGLPRIGKEGVASLVSEVGTEKAKDVLAIEAIKQDTGVTTTMTDRDIERITDRLLAENETRRMVAREGRG